MSWFKRAVDMESLVPDIQDCDGRECVESVLRTAGIPWATHLFPNGDTFFVIQLDTNFYVIDPDMSSVQERDDWLFSNTVTRNLGVYITEEDFSERFWHGREFVSRLYHGTQARNIDSIMANGLNPHNQTRGISNRSTGSAVFTTIYDQTSDEGYRHGDAVIEINTEAMRSDGYMPHVELEGPIAEEQLRNRLAWSMGFRDFENHRIDELEREGVSETTVVIYGTIPPKYLKRVS